MIMFKRKREATKKVPSLMASPLSERGGGKGRAIKEQNFFADFKKVPMPIKLEKPEWPGQWPMVEKFFCCFSKLSAFLIGCQSLK